MTAAMLNTATLGRPAAGAAAGGAPAGCWARPAPARKIAPPSPTRADRYRYTRFTTRPPLPGAARAGGPVPARTPAAAAGGGGRPRGVLLVRGRGVITHPPRGVNGDSEV